MRVRVVFLTAVCVAVFLSAAAVSFGQSSRGTSLPAKKANKRLPEPVPTPPADDEAIDADDEIMVDTTLVSIPVKVLDRNGRFVSGLTKTDFSVWEYGVEQEVAYFSNEEMPFTVALLLDMSYSTVFKINEIQQAALQFVTELRPGDKVTVISFAHEVQVLCPPTSDRKTINNAILRTKILSGTSVYEAVDMALNTTLSKIEGRKAIVLFTDGVDTTSRTVTERNNIADSLEAEAIIYPIMYDTYDDVQAVQNGKVTVSDPNQKTTTPPIGGGSIPGSTNPFPVPFPTGTISTGGSRDPSRTSFPDGTTREEYDKAAQYLDELAVRTGGRIYNAQNNVSLASAFSKIAGELREFYSLGYYPSDLTESKKRRSIKVRVSREKVSVRARDSYVLRVKTPPVK